MSKKLEILKNSLAKKKVKLDAAFENHFATVKQVNGQPLNDKRNGRSTLNKWEKQSNSIRRLKSEVEKTRQSIEKEEGLIRNVELVTCTLPDCFIKMMEYGEIIQWKKNPNRFFVPGVEKCRIIFDVKKRKISYQRPSDFSDADQWKKFARTTNKLLSLFSEEQKLKNENQ